MELFGALVKTQEKGWGWWGVGRGDGRAFGRGALVVGGGVAGCLSVDEWLHGFLVFAPSAGAL